MAQVGLTFVGALFISVRIGIIAVVIVILGMMQTILISALEFRGLCFVVISSFTVMRFVAQQRTKDSGSCYCSYRRTSTSLVMPAILIRCVADGFNSAVIDLYLDTIVILLVPPVAIDITHRVLVRGYVSKTALLKCPLSTTASHPVDVDQLVGLFSENWSGDECRSCSQDERLTR